MRLKDLLMFSERIVLFLQKCTKQGHSSKHNKMPVLQNTAPRSKKILMTALWEVTVAFRIKDQPHRPGPVKKNKLQHICRSIKSIWNHLKDFLFSNNTTSQTTEGAKRYDIICPDFLLLNKVSKGPIIWWFYRFSCGVGCVRSDRTLPDPTQTWCSSYVLFPLRTFAPSECFSLCSQLQPELL